MIALEFPKNSFPGLYIICRKCGKWISHKNHKQCTHGDVQKYRISVRHPATGKNATKTLDTKDYSKAVQETIEFKKSLKFVIVNVVKSAEPTKPQTIMGAVGMYFDYLKNINIPKHKQKKRTPKNVKDIQFFIKVFLRFLESEKFNLQTMMINEINDVIVGKYYEHIEKKNYSPSTFNKIISNMKIFYEYLITENDYLIKNPFKGITRKKSFHDITVIEKVDFNNLIKIIKKENGIQVLSNDKKKNHYYDWLSNAIKLGLFTGRRQLELLHIKFSDIKTDNKGLPIYIECEDIKANRMNDTEFDPDKKINFIPIIPELKKLLMELGYKKYKGSDRYLIAPDIETRDEFFVKRMSKAFTHYYRQLKTGKDISFKVLRKTYITSVDISTNGNAKQITGHSSNDVISKHYLDRKIIATEFAKKRFTVFN